MKIKCIDKKGYKLTLNKEYDDVTRDGNRYTMRNDSGARVTYATNLFEEILPEPEVVVEPTLEDDLDKITVTVSGTEFEVNIDGESVFLVARESHISCGIREMEGINTLSDSILNADLNFKPQCVHYIFKSICDLMSDWATFLLLSTNINHEGFDEDMLPILHLLSDSVSEAMNPNGGNDIEIYVLKVNDVREIEIEL